MLTITSLTKSYENKPLLTGISFSVAPGEVVCLLGASGSGKSTILRIIAGLEEAESGEVAWDGLALKGVPTYRRRFGLMFQDYALFPHLSVFENVAFGLKMQRAAKLTGIFANLKPTREISGLAARVGECLELVHLTGFEHRRVLELSGGEQQRVALARALAPNPRLLMLDEPLGALDRALKESLLDELRHILRGMGIPAIYVTHDQQEAFALADRIILLREGQIAQEGTPAEVFAKPAEAWVASFLGLGNVIRPGEGGGALNAEDLDIQRTILLRPQAELAASGWTVRGVVTDVLFAGEWFRVELENGWYFYTGEAPRVGEVAHLRVLRAQYLP